MPIPRPPTPVTPLEWMAKNRACDEAKAWCKDGKFRTLNAAWKACTNPAWMLWALSKGPLPATSPRYRLLACRLVRQTPLADGRTRTSPLGS